MDNETVDRTFAPAAWAALNDFPIEAEDLTLVSLSENVTFKVTDARDGQAYVLRLPPKVKLEMTVRDSDVDEVVQIILEQARTGEEGDGKIFVLPMSEARRIRTGEEGEGVL